MIPHGFYDSRQELLPGWHRLIKNLASQFFAIFEQAIDCKKIEHAIAPIVIMEAAAVLDVVLAISIAFDSYIKKQLYIVAPAVEGTLRNGVRLVIIHRRTCPFVVYLGTRYGTARNGVYKPDVAPEEVRCGGFVLCAIKFRDFKTLSK